MGFAGCAAAGSGSSLRRAGARRLNACVPAVHGGAGLVRAPRRMWRTPCACCETELRCAAARPPAGDGQRHELHRPSRGCTLGSASGATQPAGSGLCFHRPGAPEVVAAWERSGSCSGWGRAMSWPRTSAAPSRPSCRSWTWRFVRAAVRASLRGMRRPAGPTGLSAVTTGRKDAGLLVLVGALLDELVAHRRAVLAPGQEVEQLLAHLAPHAFVAGSRPRSQSWWGSACRSSCSGRSSQ